MSESVDIRNLLRSWPYDPDDDTRFVRGRDGRDLMQVRTPLGVEQYELEGRPDGHRPHDSESALDYFYAKLEHARSNGEEAAFALNERECAELFNEGTIYYFRYVRLFQMKDWARTMRDTARNLKAFDFIHRYAKREEDKQVLEKWRPYIIRVNASAAAMLELERNAYDIASTILGSAISKIEGLEELDDETFVFERERSLTGLRTLLDQIQKNKPLSDVERLEHQLRRAIERQEFERAAQLRDRIRDLKNQKAC